MAKAAKNQRAQSMAKSAPENAPENAPAKVKANDKRKVKAFEKVQDKVPDKTQDNVPANGNFDVVLGLIQRKYPGMTGYSASNLWRMTQFYEMYCEQSKLAPLVRVLSWRTT